MRVALIGESEHDIFTRLADLIEADYIPVSELGLSTVGGKSGIDRNAKGLLDYDAVFLQVDARLMLFVEPLLDELAENGIACQVKPTAFNILANKPYTFVSLASRSIPIPTMRSVASGSAIETAIEGLEYPLLIEAFRDLDRTQTMILTDKQSLYPFLRSIPFQYNLIMIQELLQDTLTESIVIADEVFSMRHTWNAERLEHNAKAQSVRIRSEERQIAVDATRALGIDIARVKMIQGRVISVDPIIHADRFEKVLGIDIASHIAAYFVEKTA